MRVRSKERRPYIRQVYLALTAHPEWFDGEAVIVAGDFNSNQIWDRKQRVGNSRERGSVSFSIDRFLSLAAVDYFWRSAERRLEIF